MYEIRTRHNVLRFRSSDLESVLDKLELLKGDGWKFFKDGVEIQREDLVEPEDDFVDYNSSYKVFK